MNETMLGLPHGTRLLGLLTLALVSSLAATTSAQDEPPAASLLRTSTAEGVRGGYGGAIDRIVRTRLDSLDVVRIRGSVALDVSEVQLALGCVGETPECLGQVAEQLSVDVLLLPNLDRAGDELILSVAAFRVSSGDLTRVVRRASGDDAETQLLDAVDGLLRELFGLPPVEPDEAREHGDGHGEQGDTVGDGEIAPDLTPPPAEPAIAGPAIVMGVGAAAMIGGVVTGVLFLDEEEGYREVPQSAADVADRDAHRESAETLALTTNILFIAGGAVAAAGVVWLVVELAGGGGSGESETVLAPWVGPQTAGLSLSGSLPEIR